MVSFRLFSHTDDLFNLIHSGEKAGENCFLYQNHSWSKAVISSSNCRIFPGSFLNEWTIPPQNYQMCNATADLRSACWILGQGRHPLTSSPSGLYHYSLCCSQQGIKKIFWWYVHIHEQEVLNNDMIMNDRSISSIVSLYSSNSQHRFC